ncbi:DUF4230 domain-containing protein [Butyrivibrio sp. YAB3001]|uniref:DUF4230 domain-containing protein n=1 Tax=Butyrivibrio sp. YAB3001 TaxID=1520812 RepID=UPI0008F62444|nr:DUF4230 domain-containing protein [Butyrivibrio sp. YAB3001]SFB73444.1 Protein of unknown function [Butyrivibrio sp. YAB3001]
MFELSKKTQNIIYLSIITISVIAIIILGVGFLKDKSKTASSSDIEKVKMKDSSEKVLVTVSTETIQDGLENMGILITQEYYFTQVERYTKEKKLLSVFNSSSELLYSYDGAVMAGINFEKIKVKKDEENKILTVEIPHSSIQAVTIDKDTFKVYSEKDSLWNPLKIEDYNASLAEYEKVAKQKALENGILERSDEQAKKLVENFINNFPSSSGYEIRFDWRTGDES